LVKNRGLVPQDSSVKPSGIGAAAEAGACIGYLADEAFQALPTHPEYQPDAQTLALAKQTSSTLAFELT